MYPPVQLITVVPDGYTLLICFILLFPGLFFCSFFLQGPLASGVGVHAVSVYNKTVVQVLRNQVAPHGNEEHCIVVPVG